MFWRVRLLLRATRVRDFLVWYRNRTAKPGDVLLASYPRSGNTWVKLMLGELLLGKDISFDEAYENIPDIGGARHTFDDRAYFKTHELFSERYRDCQTIFIVRDVRSVITSYFYYQQREGLFSGNMSQFIDNFFARKLDGYGGNWIQHTRSWIDSGELTSGRCLVIKYEDILENPESQINKMVEFLGLKVTEGQIQKAISRNKFSEMREKEKFAQHSLPGKQRDISFVRSGTVDNWKSDLSAPDVARIMSAAKLEMDYFGYV